jgi:predicted nucleic acid-binding protein
VIVVDVNVLAYLLIEGEHTAAAEAVFAVDPEWAAPLLWRSEWRNVLAGYLRRGELDRAGVEERLAAGAALVRGREYPVDDDTVLNMVAASTCSAYDCEYVALAETLGVPLVTSDAEVLRHFPERAVRPDEVARPGGPG